MAILYHGTSSFSVPLIERDGLLPYAAKVYSSPTNPDSCSNVSFGGIYVTQNRLKAEGSAKYACAVRGGKPVVFQLSVDVKSFDVWLDEDEVIEIIDGVMHTYSWIQMRGAHNSEYRKILEELEFYKDDDPYLYRKAISFLKGFDFSLHSERMISRISPEMDEEIADDMLESANNLLLSYGLHILGVQCEAVCEEVPGDLQEHFSFFVGSLNLFCSLFPEMKSMQDWESYRIMTPVGFKSRKANHWIIDYD